MEAVAASLAVEAFVVANLAEGAVAARVEVEEVVEPAALEAESVRGVERADGEPGRRVWEARPSSLRPVKR